MKLQEQSKQMVKQGKGDTGLVSEMKTQNLNSRRKQVYAASKKKYGFIDVDPEEDEEKTIVANEYDYRSDDDDGMKSLKAI